MKGGVFVGPLPESSKPLSRPSAIKNKKKALEAQALKDHLDETDNSVYDDLLAIVDVADSNSFATFARGKAIALLTKENLQNLINTSTAYNRPLQDPNTRQPFHAEVLAWVTQLDQEGPFKLTTIIPTEHTISKLVANPNYLTLIDAKGFFTIYNKDIEEVVALEAPRHNNIFVVDDGLHAITYDYLRTGFSSYTSIVEPTSYYWTITPDKVSKKELKSPAVKGAFITSSDDAYLFYTGEGFKRWRYIEQKNGTARFTGKVIKRDELYRPDNTYLMQIHYTNNKLIYYNPTTYFISYLTRNKDNTFSVLCEHTAYIAASTEISPVAFSLDGTLIATYVRHYSKIYIHDISQAKPTLVHEVPPLIVGLKEISLAFSTDKKYLFVAYSNIIQVYDISATPTLVQKIQVGKIPTASRQYVPPIRLAYFNDFVVVAIGKLVYFFKEE